MEVDEEDGAGREVYEEEQKSYKLVMGGVSKAGTRD